MRVGEHGFEAASSGITSRASIVQVDSTHDIPRPGNKMRSRHIDTLVIGGGVVGMSVAYGFARAGDSVCVLDGSDDAFR